MQRFQAVLLVALFALVAAQAASCDDGGAACDEALFAGCAGSGGGTGGGPPPCVVEDCPVGNECRDAACVDGACGFASQDDGKACGVEGQLECKAGVCQGCTAAEECTPLDCHQVDCKEGACDYTLDAAAGCGMDGTGSCSATGACGLCTDGKQNGAETGVDCGTDTQCGKCPGEACSAASECKSGFCVDGVCCDTACDSKCEACTKALTGAEDGVDGVCSPLALGSSDPDSPGCEDAGGCGAIGGTCACADGVKNGDETDVDCGGGCGATCTTGQGCSAKADCESASHECVDGVCCNSACQEACFSCDQPGRQGLCLPLSGTDTGACEGGNACSPAGACVKANGQPCSAAAECASGLCKGSSCAACDAANACAAGQACIGGSCVANAQPQGAACSGDAACESGFCVDGVCCTEKCDGTCQACNTTYTQNAQGKCYFVISGYDPQAECDGIALAGVCNGNGQCGQNPP